MTQQTTSIATLAMAAAAGSRGSLALRPDTDTQHLAWQREMERAESEAWFKTLKDKAQDKGAGPIVAAALPALPAWSAPLRPPKTVSAEPLASQGSTRDVESAAATPAQVAAASRPLSAVQGRGESQPGSAVERQGTGHATPLSDGSSSLFEPEADALCDPGGASPEVFASQLSSPSLTSPSPSRDAMTLPTVQQPAQSLFLSSSLSLSSTQAPPVAPVDGPRPIAIAVEGEVATPRSAIVIPLDGRRQLAAVLSRALEPMPGAQFHVEWNEAGAASVWIGLAASATPDLPALVDALSRWISRIGMRLHSVVCNGVSCFERTGRPRPGAANADDAQTATHSTPDIDVVIDRKD